ncbi:MAG: glycerol-3-phosphate 1-O-acyltransferase PlsY [Acidobacteria bacterium]|nr:glycerol-3-phosphate 1-O-acyltransferase PlsY [Acidobacteriota bacterium]
MGDIAAVAFGYLAGSLPLSYLLARRRGIDLRLSGSGSVGAANVLRTSGVMDGVLAMVLDAAKGAIAALVAMRLTNSPATTVAAGLAAVIGHSYPVWLRFRGGKGVATSAGVFLVFEPLAVVIAGSAFALGVFVTHYISVGSIVGAITLAVAVVLLDAPTEVIVGAVAAALIVLHRHRGNLARLYAGNERRVGERL